MHDILFSLATSLSLSLILSFHGLLGRLGFSSFFFSFKKTEIEIFFNSCKVKNSSIWWCVVGGGGSIGDIRPPFCWGLHKIKGVCVCLFTFASLYFLRRFARVVFICLCECVGLWGVCLVVFFCLLAHIEYFLWVDCFFFCCVGKVICFLPFYFQFR